MVCANYITLSESELLSFANGVSRSGFSTPYRPSLPKKNPPSWAQNQTWTCFFVGTRNSFESSQRHETIHFVNDKLEPKASSIINTILITRI